MITRSDLPPSGSARSNPGSNGGRSVRVDMTRTAHQEVTSPASAAPLERHHAESPRGPGDDLRLHKLVEEREPALLGLIREREPSATELLLERKPWPELYAPLSVILEQNIRGLVRKWDGKLR